MGPLRVPTGLPKERDGDLGSFLIVSFFKNKEIKTTASEEKQWNVTFHCWCKNVKFLSPLALVSLFDSLYS